jgi:hypothetical protein
MKDLFYVAAAYNVSDFFVLNVPRRSRVPLATTFIGNFLSLFLNILIGFQYSGRRSQCPRVSLLPRHFFGGTTNLDGKNVI